VSKDAKREATIEEVVRLLRTAREKKGISMNVLAQKSGLSQGMISLVERDLRNPSLDVLLRISEALEVDLAQILSKAQRSVKDV